MKISEFLTSESVVSSLKATDKRALIQELSELLQSRVPMIQKDELASILMDRERLSSTGIGEGVAIPHGKVPGLTHLVAAFGVSRNGVDFSSIDGKPTRMFFALLAPENSAGIHLKALARISRLFKNPAFRSAILAATDAAQIHRLIVEEDSRC